MLRAIYGIFPTPDDAFATQQLAGLFLSVYFLFQCRQSGQNRPLE
jgi:hypothetical protein